MSQIPEETIDQIKHSVNLREYIESRGVKLTKAGQKNEYRGRCPFHDDKKPSFFVNPVTGVWQYFACDIGGDVIAFVREIDRLSFPEAVRLLDNSAAASEAKRQSSQKAGEPNLSREALLAQVFDFYHKTFNSDLRGANYLQRRGIASAQLFKSVKVGFAAGNLIATLTPELRRSLIESGVLSGNGREHFLDCVIFPLLDEAGQIVNLYGRSVTSNGHYFLPGARRGLFCPPLTTGELILTEGVVDALTLLNAGYVNVLALYGVNGLAIFYYRFAVNFQSSGY